MNKLPVSAPWFIEDVAAHLANLVQFTLDGHKANLETVEGAFDGNVGYAMLKLRHYHHPMRLAGAPHQAVLPGIVSPFMTMVNGPRRAKSSTWVS